MFAAQQVKTLFRPSVVSSSSPKSSPRSVRNANEFNISMHFKCSAVNDEADWVRSISLDESQRRLFALLAMF